MVSWRAGAKTEDTLMALYKVRMTEGITFIIEMREALKRSLVSLPVLAT
jgi:hypothetical protein